MALSEDFDWSLLEGIDWETIDTPEAWETLVRERFPGFAWALDHPELGPIVKEATEGEFTATTFEARLRGTKWWTSRTVAQREWDAFEADSANEAELKDRINERTKEVAQLATDLGVNVHPEAYRELALSALRNGFDDQELIGQMLNASNHENPGAVTATDKDIRALAEEYMVTVDEATVRQMARKVLVGELDETGVRERMSLLASSQYPALGEILATGDISPKDYFAPHRQRLAQALGRSEQEIDLRGEFNQVLSIGDGGTSRPMTVSETDRYARTLDEYWTRPGGDGENALYGMTNALSKALGKRR